MPLFSLITTCKGRLEHLRQSLPLMLAQTEHCEVVVVDYACPENCGDWVAETYPTVRVVRVAGASDFNAARARNAGARTACGDWLVFLDADVLPVPDFLATLRPQLRPRCYFRPAPLTADKWGSWIVGRVDFEMAGGYDEVIEGWGGEDDDICHRLQAFHGLQATAFRGDLLDALTHDDGLRMRYRGTAGRWLGHRINACYLHIKYDLTRLIGNMPDASLRATIRDEVARTLVHAAEMNMDTARITIRLPTPAEVPLKDMVIGRELVYQLRWTRPTP